MKSDVNVAFGKRVAQLRKDAGYSQEQFAFKCDIDRTYVGTIERGEKSPRRNLRLCVDQPGLEPETSRL